MSRVCRDCGRDNGGQRPDCVYCGGVLPEPEAVVTPTDRSLPPDLDRLIHQAMTKGDTAALEGALRDHQAAMPATEAPPVVQTPVLTPQDVPVSPGAEAPPAPVSIADTLAVLGEGLDDARLAWISGDVSAVRSWTLAARPLLEAVLAQLVREEAEENPQIPLLSSKAPVSVPGLASATAAVPPPAAVPPSAAVPPTPTPQPPVKASALPQGSAEGEALTDAEPAVAPTILMPKVRHSMALIVEGMGDAAQGPALAEALGVDGVTARLIAVSRYPRFVFRGEDEVRMSQAVGRVRSDIGIRAAVVTRAQMLDFGPAIAVTQAITAEPLRLEIVDRAMWDVDLRAQSGGEPRETAPDLRLAVVGEIVVHRFRSLPQGGRLKHIRENRVQGAGEERLAVVDLHTPEGILRVVEGATDLTGFPGHTPSAAIRSLREFVTHLESQVPVMPRRICQPGLDRPGGGAVAGQAGPSQDTGWAAFEEHSRACRGLFGL